MSFRTVYRTSRSCCGILKSVQAFELLTYLSKASCLLSKKAYLNAIKDIIQLRKHDEVNQTENTEESSVVSERP